MRVETKVENGITVVEATVENRCKVSLGVDDDFIYFCSLESEEGDWVEENGPYDAQAKFIIDKIIIEGADGPSGGTENKVVRLTIPLTLVNRIDFQKL